MSCNCNNPLLCCCGNQNTNCICGPFDEPEAPDQGQCAPYRTKRTCEAPVIPTPVCDDPLFETEYNPETRVFTIWVPLHDQDCERITDQDDNPILTAIQ